MLYSFFSVICIICLAIITIGYALAIFTKGRSKRIEFIRKFKKGNCAIIYLVAIPLYFLGHLFAKKALLEAFFLAINKTMNLKLNLTTIKVLIKT
jgi:hypothetical protein